MTEIRASPVGETNCTAPQSEVVSSGKSRSFQRTYNSCNVNCSCELVFNLNSFSFPESLLGLSVAMHNHQDELCQIF